MRCWSCGTEYQGSNCPVRSIKREVEKGAERIDDAQRDAAEAQHRDAEALQEALAAQAEEQAWRIEAAAEQATRDQRQNIADSFRLQSAANNKRAAELFGAGLLDEALHHAEQAIQLDQGNLNAHLTAGRVLWRQGKVEPAGARFVKAIHVLRTVDYQVRPDWFLAVFRSLPAEEHLYGQFVNTIQRSAGSWKYSTEVVDLVLAMDKAGLKPAAIELLDVLISCAPVLQLYTTLQAVSPATSAANEARLRAFLDQFKQRREQLVAQVRVLRSMEVLPISVKAEVLRVVGASYEAWGPYIEEQIAAAGERSAQAAAEKPQASRAGIGWFVGCLIWVVGSAFDSSLWTPDMLGPISACSLVAGILGGVGAANLFKPIDRARRVATAREVALEKALDTERKLANELGLH
jgi:tetratricopeptide (TPR) repeat protein